MKKSRIFFILGLVLVGLFLMILSSANIYAANGYATYEYNCYHGCDSCDQIGYECAASQYPNAGCVYLDSRGYYRKITVGSLGSCTYVSCGDGSCDSGESCSNCPSDCGSCCIASLTCANYSGQCGTGFSNGCSNSLTCSCTSSTCSVSSGQGVCTSLNQSYWTNLNGNIISTSQVGDTVRMVAAGAGLSGQINYTVYKNSTFLYFWKWVTPISTTSSSDLWTSYETSNSVFFKTKLNGVENISTNLNIGSSSNAMPTASITSPADFFRGSVNYTVSFTQNSSDEDDLLRLTWNFGDNTNYSVANYSSITTPDLGNVNHNYSSAGVYIVKLTASEMNRSQSDYAFKTVYIFKPGINVMPLITSPINGIIYTNWVKFNASQSFIANCSINMAAFNFTAGNLQCRYVHAPLTKTVLGYNLTATWTVKDLDGSVVSGFPISGKWQQNYTQVVEFSKYFPTAARRSAYLTLDYESG